MFLEFIEQGNAAFDDYRKWHQTLAIATDAAAEGRPESLSLHKDAIALHKGYDKRRDAFLTGFDTIAATIEQLGGDSSTLIDLRRRLREIDGCLPKLDIVNEWKTLQVYLERLAIRRNSEAVSPEEMTILEVLQNEYPMTVTQEDLAAATRLTDRTVRKCVKRLSEAGLIDRPRGPKKGNALTAKGRALLGER